MSCSIFFIILFQAAVRTPACCILASSFSCWWVLMDLFFWLYFLTEKWKRDHSEPDSYHLLENSWKNWQVKGACQALIWRAHCPERRTFWWFTEDGIPHVPGRASGKALPLPPMFVMLYFPVEFWVWLKPTMLQLTHLLTPVWLSSHWKT